MSSKVTMPDMKRKVAAYLDFISRTQVELAGEKLPETGTNTPKVNGDAAPGSGPEAGTANGASIAAPENLHDAEPEREFTELNCIEMMDRLTRTMVKWQQKYAAA
jgi:hypothetical protein